MGLFLASPSRSDATSSEISVYYDLQLSSGALGELWLGRLITGPELGRLVTIRKFPLERLDMPSREMIHGLAEQVVKIRHPALVKLLHVTDTRDSLLCISEYLEGVGLLDLLKEAIDLRVPIPWPVSVRVVLDAARITIAAQRLFYRPELLSPERLLYLEGLSVASFGETLLSELGILGHLARANRTRNEAALLAQLAPEEVGLGTTDGSSEVFTLGVLLWQLLANRWLFPLDDANRTRQAVLNQPIVPLSETGPLPSELPKALEDIVARATERGLSMRFSDLRTFARALEELPGSAVASTEQVAEFVSRTASERFREHRISTRWPIRVEGEAAAPPLRRSTLPPVGSGFDFEPPTFAERKFVSRTLPLKRKSSVVPPRAAATSLGDLGFLREPQKRGRFTVLAIAATGLCLALGVGWILGRPTPTVDQPVVTHAKAELPAPRALAPEPKPAAVAAPVAAAPSVDFEIVATPPSTEVPAPRPSSSAHSPTSLRSSPSRTEAAPPPAPSSAPGSTYRPRGISTYRPKGI